MDNRVCVLNRMLSHLCEQERIMDVKLLCFMSMLRHFGFSITEEQLEKLLSVLTEEQIGLINKGLDENKSRF